LRASGKRQSRGRSSDHFDEIASPHWLPLELLARIYFGLRYGQSDQEIESGGIRYSLLLVA